MTSIRKVAGFLVLSGALAAGAAATQTDSAARRDSLRLADSTPADGGAGVSDATLRLVASISERKLTVYSGEERLKSYNVAVGTSKYPTPRGTYTIRKIVWNPGWVPPNSPWAKNKTPKAPGEAGNPMKLVKIFFKEPTYYIHGTDEIDSLGKAASHGCIRMAPEQAAELAKLLMERGGQPREESWFARVLKLKWQSRTVLLQRPIQLRIVA